MIDTHQHLLYPDRFSYSWTVDFPALKGTLGLDQYREAAAECGIEGTVFMEVDVDAGQTAEEAQFFCKMAEDPSNGILGVIASARPEADGFEHHLDAIAHPKLKGIRRVLHTQPDELSLTPLFRQNLRALPPRNLTFDLCVRQDQLPIAIELVHDCPETRFVLDHFGVPRVAGDNAPHGEGFLSWKRDIEKLAEFPNLHGKLSGITAYASEDQYTKTALLPYLDTMLETFGPERLVWGGDWPVVNLGTGLARWASLTRDLLSDLSETTRNAILVANAKSVYSL